MASDTTRLEPPRGATVPLASLDLAAAPTVSDDATLRELAALMWAAGVSAALVGDARAIVTERDIVVATARGASPDERAQPYATPDPLLVLESCPAVDALAVMLERGVRHLVVVAANPQVPPRLLTLSQASAAVFGSAGVPQWLSGLRLALHVEM